MAVMMMMREVEQRLSAAEVFERMMSSRAKPRLYPREFKMADRPSDFIGRWSLLRGAPRRFHWSLETHAKK